MSIIEHLTRAVADMQQAIRDLQRAETVAPQSGTWEPAYYGGTTAGTTTYVADGRVGRYVRLGAFVWFSGRIQWTNATGTGNAQISLPFTAVNATNYRAVVALTAGNVTYSQDAPSGNIVANTDYFLIVSPVTGGGTTISQVETDGVLLFTGHYEIAT